MPTPDWDDHYASGNLPWDSGEPEPHLVEAVERGLVTPGRTLEVGCGTGTNALWLASRGFEVLGIDIAPRAIAAANAKAEAAGARVQFRVLDFLTAEVEQAPFEFVFDRGVFHVFDEAETRAQFARQVGRMLATGGHWLSIAGSTEGPARDHGPPRRSARDLVEAVEPVLEIIELRTAAFDGGLAKAWQLLTRAREIPAQPSTRRTA
ncbi:MAG TPA: methyltransferase domain-containing protein [Enhygromyxa sp.]|nr:methyltransferase domain-containing protein [Enhygromyxa sp.]